MLRCGLRLWKRIILRRGSVLRRLILCGSGLGRRVIDLLKMTWLVVEIMGKGGRGRGGERESEFPILVGRRQGFDTGLTPQRCLRKGCDILV